MKAIAVTLSCYLSVNFCIDQQLILNKVVKPSLGYQLTLLVGKHGTVSVLRMNRTYRPGNTACKQNRITKLNIQHTIKRTENTIRIEINIFGQQLRTTNIQIHYYHS